MSTYHTGLAPGQIGDYVLMPGDPFRTALIAQRLDGARELAFSREYRTFSGSLDGIAVSTCSTGIGGPSTAIAVEELAELGARTLIRVGTCGGGQSGVRIGDLVVATGAVRGDGASAAYVPEAFPAIADRSVVGALVDAARAARVRVHSGIVRTVDALHSDLTPDRLPRAVALREEMRMWREAGVLANDMESATLLVVSSLRGLRAGVVLLCVDELDAGEIPPVDAASMSLLVSVAVDAVRRLIEVDGAAAG